MRRSNNREKGVHLLKQILSILLALALLVPAAALFSCTPPNEGEMGGGTGRPPSENQESPDFLDDVGDMTFPGMTFTVSCFERYEHEVYAEESSKDALDQLIYKRNKKIEERFGVRILPDITKMTGPADHYSHIEYLQKALSSMRPDFDMIAMYAYVSERTGLGKNLRDLRGNVPYVKESIAKGNPWWPSVINAGSTVMGRQYVGVTDFSLTAIDAANAILINETLFASYNVLAAYNAAEGTDFGDIYDLVDAGAWTLDAMTAMIKDRWDDSDERGKPNYVDTEDVIGILVNEGNHLDAFTQAFDFHYVENDGISRPTLWTLPSSYETAIGKLRTLFHDAKGAAISGRDNNMKVADADFGKFFAEGHSILIASTLSALNTEAIKSMENAYGVLPYPKLTASQARYLTGVSGSMTVLAVPRYTTGARLRLTGAMIEALSAETYKSVTDTYYEMILKHDSGIYNRRSLDMLDKIMAGRIYSLTMYHCNEFIFDEHETYAEFSILTRYLVLNRAKDVAGTWTRIQDFCRTTLDRVIQKYTDA